MEMKLWESKAIQTLSKLTQDKLNGTAVFDRVVFFSVIEPILTQPPNVSISLAVCGVSLPPCYI